jgi:superfamily II RNA helicase
MKTYTNTKTHMQTNKHTTSGIVILMLDSRLEPATAKDMIKGAPDNLYSEFHLG